MVSFQFTLVPLLAAVAVVAATPFSLASLRSGTSLQFASINANELTLAIGLPTTSDPAPSNIQHALYTNTTSFNLFDDGTILMNAQTTGVQYLYVAPQTGLARITPAHTDYIPNGGQSNFTISGNPPLLHFEGLDAYVCGSGPYRVFFDFPALNTANCQQIGLLVEYLESNNPSVWSYV